jgi:hypothetical protein
MPELEQLAIAHPLQARAELADVELGFERQSGTGHHSRAKAWDGGRLAGG